MRNKNIYVEVVKYMKNLMNPDCDLLTCIHSIGKLSDIQLLTSDTFLDENIDIFYTAYNEAAEHMDNNDTENAMKSIRKMKRIALALMDEYLET